jgi:hypothetical protein
LLNVPITMMHTIATAVQQAAIHAVRPQCLTDCSQRSQFRN